MALFIVVSIPFMEVTTWVGGHKLDVHVMVIDTDAMEPVANAEVTIFAGRRSPIEGTIRAGKPSDFRPDPDSPETEIQVTDFNGNCRFSYRFWAWGSDSFVTRSGYVDTSSVWLRVTAPDRPPALIPLDRQSSGPRDIHDETPLFVTVVLNKPLK